MRLTIKRPQVIHEIFDGEVVIINLDTGSYYSLDRVGADVWNCLDAGADEAAIVQTLLLQYQANPADIAKSVHDFLAELERESLLVAADPPAAANPAPPSSPAGTKLPFEKPVVHKYTDMEELLLLDPIHEVDEMGWPSTKQDPRT